MKCKFVKRLKMLFKCFRYTYFGLFCFIVDCIIYCSFTSLGYRITGYFSMQRDFNEFTNDVYVGLPKETLDMMFGPDAEDSFQGKQITPDSIWYPPWGTGIHKNLKHGEFDAFRLYFYNERMIFVWYVADSNQVLRVARDITPPPGIMY